ncbi:MAG: hypothetical protein K2F86_06735 [Duncaniella sp.]|nr:hypothetical protein [Duncaniella sp.]
MRNLKTYLSALFMGALALTACQDDFDDPALSAPESTWLTDQNYELTTIREVKTTYWKDADNYYATIGTTPEGKHIMVKGVITSSDASGNIYKSMVIQDETGSLSMSINANSMNGKYRRGQELVIDLTGMTIGKYSGLEQLGAPEESAQYGQQTTFMPYEQFQLHAQMNGAPDLAAVDTVTVARGADLLSTTPADLIKWQSQLVRFNNCSFADGGMEPFGVYQENTNRILTLEDGTQINVRTSGYSNFYADMLPKGHGDVVGILGYYAGSSDTGNQWQLTLIDRHGCMNFGNPTMGPGSPENPYSVDEAIALEADGSTVTQVWTTGYIVGAVAPGVTSVTANDQIQFGKDVELPTTLVIASSADCRDYTRCIVIELPQGSRLREYGNLVDHPENLGKTISLKGNLNKVYDTYGITGNQGRASEFVLEGVEVPEDPDQPGTEEGDGTEAKPYNVAQVIAMNPSSTTDAVQSNVWVKGYIVGYYADYAPHFEVSTTQRANILIAATPTASAAAECVCIQLVAQTDARNALNLVDNPGVLGMEVSVLGDVMKYNTLPGIKNTSSYKLSGDPVPPTPDQPGTPSGDGTEANPYNCASVIAMNPTSTTDAVKSDVWVKGYIVGYYENYAPHFEVSATQRANILIADTPTASAASECVCIQLVAQTDARNALNLVDNPGVLGKQVSLFGNVKKYNTLPGIKETSAYKLDGQGGGDDPTPPVPGDGGTKENPYTVSAAIALNNPGTESWVEGYIVGCVDGPDIASGSRFEAVEKVYSNILIADSANEKDYTKCLPVQLVKDTAIRAALNLGDNPGNLGKKLKISGKLELYFKAPGLKTPSDYVLE